MLSRFQLERILSELKENPNPKYWLEQYSITLNVATATLFFAKKDIESKVVYDLGCGTGRFAIGAALLGAKKVYGFDIDEEVLKIAKENAKLAEKISKIPITKRIEWKCKDVRELGETCDTVVQFPPFELDLVFFEKALEISTNVYSLHKASKRKYASIEKICEKHGAKIRKLERFKYHIWWKEAQETGYELFLVEAKKL